MEDRHCCMHLLLLARRLPGSLEAAAVVGQWEGAEAAQARTSHGRRWPWSTRALSRQGTVGHGSELAIRVDDVCTYIRRGCAYADTITHDTGMLEGRQGETDI